MGAPISWTVHCPPQAWVAASIFAALGGGGYSPVVETWDAIRTRRNVREYADRPIAAEDLDRILEAGRRSPSANNQQAWDFVAVTERDRLRELSTVWRGAWHVADSAATIAIVVPETDDPHMRELIQFDLGQATMSMMVMAGDLGIGSGHAAVRDNPQAHARMANNDLSFITRSPWARRAALPA